MNTRPTAGRLRVSVLVPLLATLLVWGAVPPESPVADAAMRGDAESVAALLQRGADVNAPQGDGMTALHWAAELGRPELATMLLAAGADPSATTRLADYTPLQLASRGGHAEVVRALLEAGADVKAATSTGAVTALHFAASSSSAETVRLLLEAGADPNARDTEWQQTPLMFAAAAGRAPVIEALLEGGADPSLTARVIDMPTREEQDGIDQERREARMAGVELTAEGSAASPEQRGPGRAELAESTRDRVAQPLSRAEMIGAYGGLSALLLAVREGNVEATRALLDGGADINAPSAGDHTPPLLMATINGHFDLAMELLQRGADPNGTDDAGAAPLYTTINTEWIPKSRHPQPADYMQQETSYLALMKALLDAGADVNARLKYQLWFTTFGDDYLGVDRMGATPFWRAAYALDVPAMRLLMEHGADPNIPTMKPAERRRGSGGGDEPDPSGLPPVPPGGPGVYPIHAASGVGYGEGYAANIHRHAPNAWIPALRYLIEELGADVNARDHNGYNAVHNAASRGDNEAILYLVEKGADVTAVSRAGQTTVDMANGPYQRITPFPATIRLLESLGAKNNHNCVSC